MVIPLGLAAAASWVGASAAFTDTLAASSSFSTGVIDLTANGSNGPTYGFSTLDVTGLVPGATPVYAQLTLANAGTAALSWSMTAPSVSDTTLGDALAIGIVRTATSGCSAATFSAGTSTVLRTEITGLSNAVIAPRTLAAGASDHVCFKVSLPAAATNTVMGRTTTATFTFSAST